jgi:hypothetical protein
MLDAKGENASKEQREAIKHLILIQQQRRTKGGIDAVTGAAKIVGAGLLLNPVTAPAALVVGATIGAGKVCHAGYKYHKKKQRSKESYADNKTAKLEQRVNSKPSRFNLVGKYKKNNAKKRIDRAGGLAEYKEKQLDKTDQARKEGTKDASRKENRTSEAIMSMDRDMQQESLASLGLDKYKKDDEGELTSETNTYYKNQIIEKQQGAFDSLKGPDLNNYRKMAMSKYIKLYGPDKLESEIKKEEHFLTAQESPTGLYALLLDLILPKSAAEKKVITDKLRKK